MNPVPVMKLVELIPALQTSDDTLQKTRDLAQAMKKTCSVSQDIPGFIANRELAKRLTVSLIRSFDALYQRSDPGIAGGKTITVANV